MAQVYGCPDCKSTEGFARYDLVPGMALITSFDADGEPEWEGTTEMEWDDQRADANAPSLYRCESCLADFSRPVLIDIEDD